ncbi:MAG: DUF4327 family protein [Microcystaceae cyanobacterium]
MKKTQIYYDMESLREDVNQWVKLHLLSVNQPIYTLAKLIPMREWIEVEILLEEHGYLLRDRIGDLIPRQRWSED